jgi:hypothetical protein
VKLHSPVFERRLRRGVRQAVRSSPELRKEARRSSAPKHYGLGILVRPGLVVLLAVAVWRISEQTQKPAAALAAISLWMFIWLCVRVQSTLVSLYSDPDLAAFSSLPVTPDRIFCWQRQKILKASVMSLVDLLAALGAFARFHDFNASKWVMTLAIALLSWLAFLSLTFLCAARWPRLPYGIVPATSMVAGLVCLFGREYIGKHLLALVQSNAFELNLLLPVGWPLSLGRLLVADGQWLTLLLLIPIGGIIWTMKGSLARLRENYEFVELTIDEPPDVIPGEGAIEPTEANGRPAAPHHLGVAAIEEIVRSRQFFAGPKWYEHGRFEKMLWGWFSPRERALSEFVFPNGFGITTPWRKLFRNLFLAVLAASGLGLVSPVLRLWVLGFGLFVTFCQALAQILGTGLAFQPTQCSGVNIPIYAAYAIGFRELARLLFKCTFVQIPLFLAFIVIGATLVAYLAGLPVVQAVILGLKAGGLLLAFRFLTVTFAFSAGTNDTARFRFRTIALLGSVVCLGLLFLALGAAGMFVPVAIWAWVFFGLAVLDAYVLFRVYGWFYHANRFDLMKVVG